MAAGARGIAAAAGAHEFLAEFLGAIGALHGGLSEQGGGDKQGEHENKKRKADPSPAPQRTQNRRVLGAPLSCEGPARMTIPVAHLGMTRRSVYTKSVNHGRHNAARARA